jgi:EmrB/QacA subfamily drug resistance transporter
MQRRWWTLVAVCLGVFMLLLDVTIVNVALPDIQKAFSASLSNLQWVIDAYALVLAALLLTAGAIADSVGRRRLFAVGIVLFTLSSLLCGAAGGWLFLSVARGLQGVGGAIMFATSLALIAQAFPPADRGLAFGVFGAVTGVAVAVGPVVGGLLTSGLSWRWIFFVNLPLGVIALLITLLRLEESRDPDAPRPDVPGFVSFSTALACLVFGLIRSEPDGWASAPVAGTLVAAVVLLAAFVVIEARSAAPMFDLRLLRVPTFTGGLVAAWAISASIFSMLTYLVIYFQGVLGYSALQTGLRILPLSGAIFVAAGIAGRLSQAVPVRWLISPGFLLVGAGILLLRGVQAGDSWLHFLPGFVVAGVGAGLINVPLASTAVGVVEPGRAGMASGANSTFRQVGIATGVAVLGSIFSSRLSGAMDDALAPTPLAARSKDLGQALTTGRSGALLDQLTPAQRGLAGHAIQQSFATALNSISLVAAIVAGVAGVATMLLIRQRDVVFAAHPGAEPVPVPAATR